MRRFHSKLQGTKVALQGRKLTRQLLLNINQEPHKFAMASLRLQLVLVTHDAPTPPAGLQRQDMQ
jgi:hypothetical protein